MLYIVLYLLSDGGQRLYGVSGGQRSFVVNMGPIVKTLYTRYSISRKLLDISHVWYVGM